MSNISPLLLLAVVLIIGSQDNPQGTTTTRRPTQGPTYGPTQGATQGPTRGPTQGATQGPTRGPTQLVEGPASSEDHPLCAHATDAQCNEDVFRKECPNMCARPVTCPLGYWNADSSKEYCYKLITASKHTFNSALSKCASDSATLAYPLGGEPVVLRAFLVKTYGHALAWLGARGSGSQVVTVDAANKPTYKGDIPSGTYWYPGNPGSDTSSIYSMILLANQSSIEAYANRPWKMVGQEEEHYPLCQKRVINV